MADKSRIESEWKNIILTGYRAVGKTSVGKVLARQLRMDFIDTDQEIVRREGREIKDIVAREGWGYFREREGELLVELAAGEGMVIATGGGAITHENWPRLMASGLVVWLTADEETICRRLTADTNTADQRPSLTNNTVFQEVSEVLAARRPLYQQGSHIRVDTAQSDIQSIVDEIISSLP
ncbi:MAG TPA: shikimate kinase [Desulfobacterales bacterium]|nr:shikimate kinase [Desulfobacterales bacterium]